MTHFIKRKKDFYMLCGFLAPDGTYTECEFFEHLDLANNIAEKKYNQNFESRLQAEDYLYDLGYIGLYARNASHLFRNRNNVRQTILLTKEQINFLILNLENTNNESQKTSIQELLTRNEDYIEQSILTEMECAYFKEDHDL